jgi:hypothetical protein
MKIKTFSELREAAKDKAAKAQATTKDKESDLFGTSRVRGEQDFRDAHGMDVQIKSNKLILSLITCGSIEHILT